MVSSPPHEQPATRMNNPSLIELVPGIAQPAILADSAYHTLKHQILTCRLQPGQRVYERDISAEMRVSRTPIREALNRLGLEGLVQPTPHRGFKVAPVTVEGFRRLCEVRRVVEVAAAGLAAQRATPQDVDQLKGCAHLSYVPGDQASYEAYLRANCAFHLTLARCTRNPDLESIVIGVIDKLQRPLYLGLNVGIDAESSSAEHFRIVEAVERHDHARARQLMLEHAEAAERRIASALEVAGY
jgi:DNA-binding GntR family transcriptional regulator